MFIFKILLIILVAAPFIALASYFYLQMLEVIKDKNRQETAMIAKSIREAEGSKDTAERKKKKKRRKDGNRK